RQRFRFNFPFRECHSPSFRLQQKQRSGPAPCRVPKLPARQPGPPNKERSLMRQLLCAFLTLVVLVPAAARAEDKEKNVSVLGYKMKTIDGKEVELSKYKGKVVMFVNVASKCGLTPQYDQLQALHDKYSKKGLVIVGVPANEFGKQEPGTESEIKKFCADKYNVKFVMLSKQVGKG